MVVFHGPLESVAGAETAAGQIEMAFVPASERQHLTPAVADTIITVGQRSQQKKKRKRNTALDGLEDDVEMFDYAAEPSLLDVGDVKKVGPMIKKRNRGVCVRCRIEESILTTLQDPGPVQYGSFPAPPKAHNQPKSGNQSHSFR